MDKLLSTIIHPTNTDLPPIRTCDTPSACDTGKAVLTPDEITRLIGCRRLKRFRDIELVGSNAILHDTGEPTPSLGTFATVPRSPRNKTPLQRPKRFFQKAHCDIGYGDCPAYGGIKYVLTIVDRCTRYVWTTTLKALDSSSLIHAFKECRAECGRLPSTIYTDCDPKLFSRDIASYLLDNNSKIRAAPQGLQNQNGLVEAAWKQMVKMARAYLTDMQCPKYLWHWAILHASRIMNYLPVRVGSILTTPFELVHGIPPDWRIPFRLFATGYFRYERKGCVARTMQGIAVGRDNKTNGMLFYNPINQRTYSSGSFKLDSSLHTPTRFGLQYDGGIFFNLKRGQRDRSV